MDIQRDTTWRETPNNGQLFHGDTLQLNDQFHIWYNVPNLGPSPIDDAFVTVTTTPGISILPTYSTGCNLVSSHEVICNSGRTIEVSPTGDDGNVWAVPYLFKVNSQVDSSTQTITAQVTSKQSGEINFQNNVSEIIFRISSNNVSSRYR